MQRFNTVESYITGHPEWKALLIRLREIIQSTELTETVKWGAPVYTIEGKNIVGLGAFKSYVGLWFFQGALLTDPSKKLVNAQEGKTKAMRQWRFHTLEEMDENLIKEYLEEAIQNQKQGKEIKPAKNKPLIIPDELKEAMVNDPLLDENFHQLTLSKQREYADHINEAKRTETKQKRLEKIIPMILEKVGLHDKYRNC